MQQSMMLRALPVDPNEKEKKDFSGMRSAVVFAIVLQRTGDAFLF